MAAVNSVYSETLQEITNTKLEELSKRRAAYEADKTAVLESVGATQDPIERLRALSRGVQKCLGVPVDQLGNVEKGWSKHPTLENELKNLARFLAQASHDPSISLKMTQKWEEALRRHLDSQSLKFEYASLYGQLVNEWLSSTAKEGASENGDIDMKEDYETIGNAKKLAARMAWEKAVFEPANVDLQKLMGYLDSLFGVGNPEKRPLFRALVRLREEVKEFERELRSSNQFTPHTLRWVIQGLLRSDLLADGKREVLRDFANNEIILGEIGDVLNMRMSAIGEWSWGTSVPLEQRRKITGAFSIHMDEDLLQAIFLHYIGVKLSIFFKGAFGRFRRDRDAWISNRQRISLAERSRLEYSLGTLDRGNSLQVLRRREHRKNYFMSQLVSSENQSVESAEGDEEADYTRAVKAPAAQHPGQVPGQAGRLQAQQQIQAAQQQLQQLQMQQMGRHMARQSPGASAPSSSTPRFAMAQPSHKRMAIGHAASSHGSKRRRVDGSDRYGDEDSETDDEDEVQPRNPMKLKTRLLHLLSTEITINTALHGELTAFHSGFDSWYSLFPHQTIETIVALFGFSEIWRKFFKAFLEAPLKFLDDDDATPARKRVRGAPGAHALSEVFGEVTLFVLDFAVNQKTGGSFLWRLHDDIWFWSPNHQLCVNAWQAVTEFAEATGTAINHNKTGTVRIGRDAGSAPAIDRSLPKGEIRWGFLYLSADTGRFVIDQKIVDEHIVELRKQLKEANRSVFNFIQTWNVYVTTFFTSNFGRPAHCFGRDHVDEMLKTHRRIQHEIFSSNPSLDTAGGASADIVAYLKNTLEERFGVNDVPDGYLFFPAELGGLDLESPFVSLLPIRDSLLQSSAPLLARLEESEAEGYQAAKKAFEDGTVLRARYNATTITPTQPVFGREAETFVSFEEYVKYREELNLGHRMQVHQVYVKLLEKPGWESVEGYGAMVSEGIAPLSTQKNLRGILNNWDAMEPYWKWVTMLYGPEVLERFGGLSIVDSGLLPMGMVRLFRENRVKWQS